MWPFKRKPAPRPISAPFELVENNPALDALIREREAEDEKRFARLKTWLPVGEKFTYVGVSMTVKNHVSNVSAWWGATPGITANYADATGVIREHKLSYEEACVILDRIEREASSRKKEQPQPR